MTQEFRELLGEVAGQVKQYDVAEPAIAVARRSRRRARLVPVVGAAAVALGLLAVWLPLSGGSQKSDRAAVRPVSWLPERVTEDPAPPALPRDRAVGPAALVRWVTPPGAENPTMADLVLPDGSQYRVVDLLSTDDRVVGLSPDGRYLVLRVNGAVEVRDLTTGGAPRATYASGQPGLAPIAWSPDSRWLLLGPNRFGVQKDQGPATEELTVLDLAAGSHHTVTLPVLGFGDQKTGIRSSGDIVLATRLGPAPGYEIQVRDGRTGQQKGQHRVDLTAATDQTGSLDFGPDEGTLIVQVWTQTNDPEPLALLGELLLVDLTGQVRGRYRIGDPNTDKDLRTVAAVTAQGVFIEHVGNGFERIELLNLATGKRQVVCELPGGRILLRGFTIPG